MRALLDEQLSPRIAVLLSQRGFDVISAADRSDLAGCSDRVILETASTEQRAVVTNNIKDFRPLAAERLARGQSHGGLILLPSSRTRTRAAIGALAAGIEAVLREHPDGLTSSERWIGPLGRWWAKALGWVVVADAADEFEIRSAPDRLPGLLFVPVAQERAGKNRLHPDFRPVDQAAEVARLLSLGARRVDVGQGDASWVVLADPEGNEFCILRGRARPDSSQPAT